MRTKRRPFTYANVIATLALFLALGGGVVLASSKLNGSQIKKNSEPGNRIKKNTLPNNRVKKATLKADRFAKNQLPGVIVADASATNLPGVTTNPVSGVGTSVPLTGTASFTPVAGKSYIIVGEIQGNPIDADGAPGNACNPSVHIFRPGNPFAALNLSLFQDLGNAPAIQTQTVDAGDQGISANDPSSPITLTAQVFGDSNCGAGSTINSLRITVVQLG
jgi:hypothetical protein